jgi:hypothetical protein
LRSVEKSTWWGTERNSQRRLSRRSSERLTRIPLAQPIWPGRLKEERGIMACKMTLVHQMMSLGMVLPRGDITQSSIHDAQQIEIDYETGHGQSETKLVRLRTRGSRYTALWYKTPWPRVCLSINTHPHLPKDNEEVNAHVKRLQVMLDAATVVDTTLDYDDEAQDHELDHRQCPRGDSTSSLTPPEKRG